MARQIVYTLLGLIALSLGLVQCAHSPHAVSIQVSPASASLASAGQTVQFEAFGDILTGYESSTGNVTNQVTWSSSSTSVATINSSGLATAVSAGTTTITATLSTTTSGVLVATATLTVAASAVARDLTSITIIPSSQTVNALGESAQFIAIGNYSGNPTTVDMTSQVTWQSSDTTVVTIESTGQANPGLATANHNDQGNATITASAVAPVSGNLIVGTAQFSNSGTGGSLVPVLTVTELGAGSGTVVSSATVTTQAGLITCPPTSAANACSASYPVGTTVTLTATPASGSSFGGWSANCTPANANSCQVIMNGNEPVAAIFNLNQP